MTHDNPIAAIQAAAASVLRDRGERASQAAVARVVGVAPAAWSRWCRGEVSPSSAAVDAAVEAWPGLTVCRVEGGWTAAIDATAQEVTP